MLIYHVAYALQQQQLYAQYLAHQDVQYVIVIHAYAAQDAYHSPANAVLELMLPMQVLHFLLYIPMQMLFSMSLQPLQMLRSMPL